MIGIEVPESRCGGCGKINDAVDSLPTGHVPSRGDFTVCVLCGHIMAFNEDLTLRELTSEEMHAVAGDPKLLQIQRARGILQRDKGR